MRRWRTWCERRCAPAPLADHASRMPQRRTRRPQPCTSVCRMSPAPACAKAACARSTRSPRWSRMDDDEKRAVWVQLAQRSADTARRRAHEAPHLLLRRHLAVRLPRVRAPAAGARRPVATASTTGRCCSPALLSHWGQKGPAEIEPKRAWTFRHVHWLAHAHGVAMQHAGAASVQSARAAAPRAGLRARRPHARPPCLRAGVPPRLARRRRCRRCGASGGAAAQLAPARDPAGDEVKQALKDATARPSRKGVFGVPTIEVDGRAVLGRRCARDGGRLPARRCMVRRTGVGCGGRRAAPRVTRKT